jgi:hypothetical protein
MRSTPVPKKRISRTGWEDNTKRKSVSSTSWTVNTNYDTRNNNVFDDTLPSVIICHIPQQNSVRKMIPFIVYHCYNMAKRTSFYYTTAKLLYPRRRRRKRIERIDNWKVRVGEQRGSGRGG